MRFVYQIAESSIYCSSFEPIDSRMYVIHHKNHVLIIDPIIEDSLHAFLQRNLFNHVQVILTHEHYDHISGVNWLRELTQCTVLCSASCGEGIQNPRKNLSQYFTALFGLQNESVRNKVKEMDVQPYCCEADQTFTDNLEFTWLGHHVSVRETPGHSVGSVCILLDNQIIFTGDSLTNGTPSYYTPARRKPSSVSIGDSTLFIWITAGYDGIPRPWRYRYYKQPAKEELNYALT